MSLIAAQYGADIDEVPTDFDTVVMGIKPSAPNLHMGHWVTARSMIGLLQRQPKAKGIVVLDDRQGDCSKASKYDLNKRAVNARTLKKKVNSFLNRASIDSASDIARRTAVISMSDYMQTRGNDSNLNGSALYEVVCESRDIIGRIYPDYLDLSKNHSHTKVARPLCPNCRVVPLASEDLRQDIRKKLIGICPNTQCLFHNCEYEVDPSTPYGAGQWGLHFLFAALRDVRIADDNNSGIAHVYGADYLQKKQSWHRPNADRMHELLSRLIPKSPVHIYVGPLVQDSEGNKLSKSNGDQSDIPTIEDLDRLLANGTSGVITMPKSIQTL